MSHRQTLKVAAAQYPIDQPATLDAWRDKIARWVADGAATGAEVLVFPEYAAIEQAAALGEQVYGDLDATLQAVADLEGDRVGLHQELAAKHRVHILVGSGPVAQRRRPLRQRGAARDAQGQRRRAGKADHDAVRDRLGHLGRHAGARVRYRARPDRHQHLLRQRVPAAGARHGRSRRRAAAGPLVHRARLGLSPRAHRLDARARWRTRSRRSSARPSAMRCGRRPSTATPARPASTCRPSRRSRTRASWRKASINAGAVGDGDIDLARLRHLRTSGEMRNYIDWPNQAGAQRSSPTTSRSSRWSRGENRELRVAADY